MSLWQSNFEISKVCCRVSESLWQVCAESEQIRNRIRVRESERERVPESLLFEFIFSNPRYVRELQYTRLEKTLLAEVLTRNATSLKQISGTKTVCPVHAIHCKSCRDYEPCRLDNSRSRRSRVMLPPIHLLLLFTKTNELALSGITC